MQVVQLDEEINGDAVYDSLQTSQQNYDARELLQSSSMKKTKMTRSIRMQQSLASHPGHTLPVASVILIHRLLPARWTKKPLDMTWRQSDRLI